MFFPYNLNLASTRISRGRRGKKVAFYYMEKKMLLFHLCHYSRLFACTDDGADSRFPPAWQVNKHGHFLESCQKGDAQRVTVPQMCRFT
ncbi:hypothetical protein CEXT_569331 [Caerostris extrusa]|uniref:Uncharacterized protein n=1 Tax=Caerostris extrusa TaxID=172846 RepID=A0AAV4SQZ0_CAEEX|nr:hypothetical protein CEXT_569331 [Caerostris extrusa]